MGRRSSVATRESDSGPRPSGSHMRMNEDAESARRKGPPLPELPARETGPPPPAPLRTHLSRGRGGDERREALALRPRLFQQTQHLGAQAAHDELTRHVGQSQPGVAADAVEELEQVHVLRRLVGGADLKEGRVAKRKKVTKLCQKLFTKRWRVSNRELGRPWEGGGEGRERRCRP